MSLRLPIACTIALALLFGVQPARAQSKNYNGFDLNVYPGDAALSALRKSFDYVGYWLNVPPGATTNNWKGKREPIRQNGFGFLVLYNGHFDAEFKKLDPGATGNSDAAKAIAAATAEGFPEHTIIFLDLEEGGRMMPNTAKYVAAWVAAIRRSKFKPGAYCSGVEVDDDPGVKISTADDIHNQLGDVALWLIQDGCPPAPGCTLHTDGLQMSISGRSDALVWQYAQSPQRKGLTRSCMATYTNGNCYAPGTPKTLQYALDMDISTSPDPSNGR